ncbi:MAG: AAA family ATPase [Desulfobacteraceae bacterium]|nr:AAA family ATPase [Desulfobacteraceae bacterium]
MKYIADFHVHSKYSRATARNLDLEHLYIAARIKGITVVGTGDFTHPAWFGEILEKLEPAEPGLFKLKESLTGECDRQVPESCKGPVRFILTTEISNIYKKNDRTRKNHNLLFLPDLEDAKRLNARLETIGNIRSDGRPILGLDARHLLEILLEESPEGFLVPAHIWTPWFSMLGSKSGFDSIEECFEDLSSEIFAAETGLSSDPPMNRRLSSLDRITLISNSDAHSPFNLGREANRFHTDLSFHGIKKALKTGNPEEFLGTFEFYPEEGKYHFDGHRKCGICFDPRKSISHKGLCPECGKPLTLGVLYRVEELADRKPEEILKTNQDYASLIPLASILSDLLGVGPKSGKVMESYNHAIQTWGPELTILHELPIDDLHSSKIPLLGEAVLRMREGRIDFLPGYDGEYGKVNIFTPEERQSFSDQKPLFRGLTKNTPRNKKPEAPMPKATKHPKAGPKTVPPKSIKLETPDIPPKAVLFSPDTPLDILADLNDKQQAAVRHGETPLLISAGPGTGKTRTITYKMVHLISAKNIPPENILAVTFTNKAAQEMKERLAALLKNNQDLPEVNTFHGFCNNLLFECSKQTQTTAHTLIDDEDQLFMISRAVEVAGLKKPQSLSHEKIRSFVATAKQQMLNPKSDLSEILPEEYRNTFPLIYGKYQELLNIQGLMDFEDLIFHTVWLMETPEHPYRKYVKTYSHVFVDEYQDLNHGQYRIIKALCPTGENLCVIGDPDQSIYGFRGSDPAYFKAFMMDFPGAEQITLDRNYRSCETILKGSKQILGKNRENPEELKLYSGIQGVKTLGVISSPTEKSEAVSIGKRIEQLVGGLGFHSMDFGLKGEPSHGRERSFSDFALLYRTQSQGRILADALMKANIPCRMASRSAMFNLKGIRELISFLRLMEDKGTLTDLERIGRLPNSGLGLKALESFKSWFFQNSMTVSEALTHVRRLPVESIPPSFQAKLDRFAGMLSKTRETLKNDPVQTKINRLAELPILNPLTSNHPEMKDSLAHLLNIASAYGHDSHSFLCGLALKTDVDFYDPRAESVTLMTLHASKGLEFPVVFICGCEEGLIPFIRFEGTEPDPEEERRLFYVAMTRAREELYFSWCRKRTVTGKYQERKLSRFVEDIQNSLLRNETETRSAKKDNGSRQLPLF